MPLRSDIIDILRADAAPIVVLTGAGISKESGLHTFRDPDGIWARYDISEVATPEAFINNPDLVHHFYNDRRAGVLDPAVQPNAAHLALARLEAEWPGDVLLVTQNIDDLHNRAGSKNLIHMHGELLKIRCNHCDLLTNWSEPLDQGIPCPSCAKQGGLRPHVVWFGEMPLEMERIYTALANCGLFISIGTSGNVYPAAGFVQMAREEGGAETVELNLEPSNGATSFEYSRYGAASEIVPSFVSSLIG
ncbi:NAD-dependent deacylase [Thalassospira xianhensis]|uniref:NAD-dependent deacylase n=1 Tax=Thalassospira xianhensis TaxID=478503 RepID=UPI000DED6E33|nr:NAD-dependent deacylase [Thalassospira xianhensis]UKV14438.1 NAD-dependent deacylase [Thalassospiraceae bacterium SW-3-3]